MRVLFLPFALFAGIFSYGQSPLPAFDQIEVVEAPGTPTELYRKAERWMVDTFKDSHEAIQLRDTATHTLVVKGFRSLSWVVGKGVMSVAGSSPFTFSMEVACKDNRYRIRMYDAIINGAQVEIKDTCYAAVPNEQGPKNTRLMPVEMRDQACSQVMQWCRSLPASLKSAMLKSNVDW